MRMDWASLLVILLAVALARLFKLGVFTKGGSSTSAGAVTRSPAEPVVIYENPIDKYLAENYPKARR